MPASQIDEQVVKMSFDNSNFDSNVNDSIKTLNNLDKRLAIFDDKEHLNNINTSFSNLANTFSIKGQIMFGVLTSLGKEIYSLGKRAFGALTKGIRDGIGEYHTIIESTEAIYQNVKQNGNSLQDVNNALDELNDYADKTIYNFGQMTRMIGMFSSAGVGLKSSVSTIKGLANSAALVGANMQKAQMAWNAVSRAMSSGRFTNVTWRSLELSGIAGKQFNKVITEVARTMKVKGKQTGKDIDGMIKKWGSLRESLREGWLTKDVFTEAMDIMSGALDEADLKRKGYTKKQINELREIANAAEEAATRVKTFKQLMDTIGEAIGSGWAQSFRILIGDLEDAKKLYTRISNVISDFIDNNANIRNELFKQIVTGKDKGIDGKWKSGQDNFRQIIENMLAIVKTFLKSVKTGFYNIFPIERISAACRKILNVFEQFTRAFILNTGKIQKDGQELWDTTNVDNMSSSIKDLIRFFRGLASAVDIAWMAISQPIKVIIKRVPFLNNFFSNTNKNVQGIVQKLGRFGDKITVFRNAIKSTNFFGETLEYLLDNIDILAEKSPIFAAIVWTFTTIKSAVYGIRDGFKKLDIKPFSTAFGILKFIVTAVWKALNGIFGLFQSAASKIDWSWLEKPKRALASILKAFSDYGKGLIKFEDITAKIGISFKGIFDRLKKTFEGIRNTFIKIGNTAKSVFGKIQGFFTPIINFFKNLSTNSNIAFGDISKKLGLIGGGVLAASLGISHFVKQFKKIQILSNINDLLDSGIDVLKAYERQAKSKTILNIAAAVAILAGAMLVMALIPYDKMENGFTMFTGFMMTLMVTLTPLIGIVTALIKAISKLQKAESPLNTFIKTLGKFGKQISSGINARLKGKAMKDIAISIAIIVASIIALKVAFKDAKEIIPYASVIIITLAAFTGALMLLSFALSRFTKAAKDLSGAAATFSAFFSLSGVAAVILSIAVAMAVLAQSFVAISKIDDTRLWDSWGAIMGILGLLGLIVVAISLIISKTKEISNLKKVTLKISGAILGMALVIGGFIAIMKMIQKDTTNSWWKAILTLTAVIGVFSSMVIAFVNLAMRSDDAAWKRLNKFFIVVSACLLTLVGGLVALSYAKEIPSSIVDLLKTLAIVAGVVLSIVAFITAASPGAGFAGDFAKVIQGISFAVSALAASFGIIAIGLSMLITAIGKMDITSKNAAKASNNVIAKLEYVAEVIDKSLPALRKLFASVGVAAASLISAFLLAFVTRIAEMTDQYNQIAEKIVNTVIDIVKKVVDVLYTRKDELTSIFSKVIKLMSSILTTLLNEFFRSGATETKISEADVSKMLGFGVILSSTAAFANKFNNIFNMIKNGWTPMAKALTKANQYLLANTANTSMKISKTGKLVAKDYALMAIAVAAAVKAMNLASKGLRQMFGEEQRYYDASIKTTEDKFIAFFTNTEYRTQTLIDTMTVIGRTLANVLQSVAVVVITLVAQVFKIIFKFFEYLTLPLMQGIRNVIDILKNLGLISDETYNKIDKFTTAAKDIADAFDEFTIDAWTKVVNDWKHITDNSWGTGKEAFEKAMGQTGKESAQAFKENMSAELQPYASTEPQNFATVFGNTLNGRFNNIGKTVGKNAEDIKNELFNKTKEIGNAIPEGMTEGIKETGSEVIKSLWKQTNQGVDTVKTVWKTHSPSKVAEEIYKDVMLGEAQGVEKNKKGPSKALAKSINAQIKQAKDGAELIKKALAAQGYTDEDMVDTIRILNVDMYDSETKDTKKIELNRQYLELVEQQKEAIIGKTRAEAEDALVEAARAAGMKEDAIALGNVLDYLFSLQDNKTKILNSGIEKMTNNTMASVADVIGEELAAQDMAVTNAQQNYNELMTIAKEHQSQLIGKKREEVQAFLEQEALKRGMTEEEAKETAKAATAALFAGTKSKAKLTQGELTNQLNAFDKNYNSFVALEKAKNAYYQKAINIRSKIDEIYNKKAAEYGAQGEKVKTGQMTWAEYQVWAKNRKKTPEEQQLASLQAELKTAVNGYNDILEKQRKSVISDGIKTEKSLEKSIKEAGALINDSKTASRGSYESLITQMKKLLGQNAGAPNTNTWNFGKTNTDNSLKDTNDNAKKAVDAAKKTKDALEKNRADLTPTFDLDKLSDEAKKANGIVMSSLMAAQNASIGDYINKDSELNPFMKDRWQNVYNFTQNNYSPKALSRIDIYRQTQRQISMSRGF